MLPLGPTSYGDSPYQSLGALAGNPLLISFADLVADGLLTNFHLPGSSLLMLVTALLGGETWRAVYDHAVAHDLRLYSYGDCMLALPESAGAAGETM